MVKGLSEARLSTDGRIKSVRADHVARYQWAAGRISGNVVIDAGCNCGYGSAIIADAGVFWITGVDCWQPGLDFARQHWHRERIRWVQADFELLFELDFADALVAFEIIEHLTDPKRLLIEARRVAGQLFTSVPNEAVWAWESRLLPVHKRHYTRGQFEALLSECGWIVAEWHGQAGPHSPVEPGVEGRTLVVECR